MGKAHHQYYYKQGCAVWERHIISIITSRDVQYGKGTSSVLLQAGMCSVGKAHHQYYYKQGCAVWEIHIISIITSRDVQYGKGTFSVLLQGGMCSMGKAHHQYYYKQGCAVWERHLFSIITRRDVQYGKGTSSVQVRMCSTSKVGISFGTEGYRTKILPKNESLLLLIDRMKMVSSL